MDPLTDTERAMLDMEAEWFATAGGKETAIRDRFGVTPARYYQQLAKLITRSAALEYDAVTVNRLLRITKGGDRG